MTSRRVRFGAFVLDLETKTLRKDGRVVKLAPKPTKLLTLLVRRADDVVPHDVIQNELWDEDEFVEFRQAVSFCVKQLRDGLGDDAENPRYIETVPRTGYRFVADVHTVEAPRRGWGRTMSIAAGVIIMTFGILAVSYREDADVNVPRGRPTVSVSPFENRTGDPDLDWLELGVSEMLITELAESRDIDVLRGGGDTVLRGSFVRVGDRVRIDAHIDERATNTVVGSETVEGIVETDLLAMVEELSKRVRLRLELTALGHDHDLASITTSSVEAYRHYIQALERIRRNAWREAVPHLEEAIAIDRGFATAIVNLAMTHGYLGTEVEKGRWAGSPDWVNAHWERRRELTERAFELSHRLPGRERLYIEANFHRMRGDDGDAMGAFEKATELYPDHFVARMSLASRYATHHMFEKAAEELEAIRRLDNEFRVGDTQYEVLEQDLSAHYDANGKHDEASRILADLVARFPEDPTSFEALGDHLIVSGELDEAAAAYERARSLRTDGSTPIGLATVAILRGDVDGAEDVARTNDNAFYRALVALYRGGSNDALELLWSISSYERIYVAWPAAYLAETLLQLDRPAPIIELETHVALQAMALARLGRVDEAEARTRPFRNADTRLSRIFNHRVACELAHARGNEASATESLRQAERLLSPRAILNDETPQHVPIWYAIARAEMEGGNLDEAELWLRKIVGGTSERVFWPIAYVRSLYFLGQIHEARGEPDAARSFYLRFYEHWKDGDLDPKRVAHARKLIGD